MLHPEAVDDICFGLSQAAWTTVAKAQFLVGCLLLRDDSLGLWLGLFLRENHIAVWVCLMNDTAWTLIDLPKVNMVAIVVVIIKVISLSITLSKGFSVVVR